MHLQQDGREGYTLVELLVATTLLGLVAAATMTLFVHAGRAAAEARQYVTALGLAEQKMEELRDVDWGSIRSEVRQDCSGFSGFAYDVQVVPAGAGKRITVTVYYTCAGGGERAVSLTTERGAPW